MPLADLLEAITAHPRLAALAHAIRAGEPVPGAVEAPAAPPNLALLRSARLAVAAALWRALRVPVLYITDRTDHRLQAQREIALWLGDSHAAPGVQAAAPFLLPFPAPASPTEAPDAWDELTRTERLRVLAALAAHFIPAAPRQPLLVFTTAAALLTPTLSRRALAQASRRLKAGQRLSPPALARNLVALGYQPASVVTASGQFARRGGIVDLWPPTLPHPVRLDFFGDEVDALRSFDPATQRTTGRLDDLLLTPAAERLPEAPATGHLLDYLPPRSLVLIEDWEALQAAWERLLGQYPELTEHGEPLTALARGKIRDAAVLSLGPAAPREQLPPDALAARFRTLTHYGGRVRPFLHDLRAWLAQGQRVLVASRQTPRLRELWREQPQPPAGSTGRADFLETILSAGFAFLPSAGAGWRLFTDAEIFGWRPPKLRRRAQTRPRAPESAYADLRPGDFVVHVDHGIGRFQGVVRRTLEGKTRDYLLVAYAEGDQLFVPVHQADRLTRYIGPDDRPPAITRLGGSEWPRAKKRVREAVQQMAEELLDLYARRQTVRGHAFAPDTDWQRELEAAFPYLETEDQQKAIAAVKADMESPRPMDRLICGDVGYGKTEVALRAAFKAVMDDKQVAMLVPTTVLAQQHFRTFSRRLAPFPVMVEMLSRFRTPAEQRRILRDLAAGKIDILIGTHRLLSRDVKFKDLGLVIIDEEQRFGVAHKEHLKRLRTAVDVLTLTATPIPRTLYMALTGVRDISVIETPPAARLPVRTYIGPYDPDVVRQAILREINRGGQVFFVHNRVQTIEAMRRHLERLTPEARIAVGHGQMSERELARVMEAFARREVDVLLSTTIIESGLDFPNANTLIVDRADTFGLAQLYQLRGRVGRGPVQAYAYFFRHRRRAPTPEGRLRLETLAEHTDLGAGYSIAMRDLEMRGAGDILGARQHGHMAAVGFHLYTRLLAEAVRRLRESRGLPAEDAPAAAALAALPSPTVVDLPLEIGLPEDYISDQEVRLGLYRRLAETRSLAALDDLAAELADRFGALPPAAENLLFQMRVKILAQRGGIAAVRVESGQVVLQPAAAPPGRLRPLPPPVRTGKRAYWVPYHAFPRWREVLLRALTALASAETQAEATRR